MPTWRPARLTAGDIRVLTIVLGLAAILRGADYWTSVPPPIALTVLESLLPRHVISAIFMAAGLVLLGGGVARRHLLVFAGHAVLWVLYVGVTIGALMAYLPLHDGIRNAGALAVVTALHGFLMTRTGSRPLERPHP